VSSIFIQPTWGPNTSNNFHTNVLNDMDLCKDVPFAVKVATFQTPAELDPEKLPKFDQF